MEKFLLSDFLRSKIQGKYGSIVLFAEATGLSYERLKKSLQRNRFSKDDLDVFCEQLGIVEVDFSTFQYERSRRTSKQLRHKEPLLEKTISGLVPKEFTSLVVNNPIVLEKIRTLVTHECVRIRDTINN